MKTTIIIFLVATLGSCLAVNDDDMTRINYRLKSKSYARNFDANLNELLKQDPDYFNFRPFTHTNENKSSSFFTCDTNYSPSADIPTSVHQLRPKDIKVIGAIGDSITAAFGLEATSAAELFWEIRGKSWSVGGDGSLDDYVTLPNFLKKYNPELRGYSTGKNVLYIYNSGRKLNQAVSNKEANHMPGQAKELVREMKRLPGVDLEKDWKMITLFIGGNDLCRSCKNDNEVHLPENYIAYIKEALDYLRAELPRVFVNLVTIMDIEQVKDLRPNAFCANFHRIECPCGAYPTPSQAIQLRDFIDRYQNYTSALVDSGRYDTTDDFTVVVQPFFSKFEAPKLPNGKPDMTYLAPDCFHMSGKGHAGIAVGLWNNLLQPVGEKSNTWKPEDPVLCPTQERPYLFTNKNSK